MSPFTGLAWPHDAGDSDHEQQHHLPLCLHLLTRTPKKEGRWHFNSCNYISPISHTCKYTHTKGSLHIHCMYNVYMYMYAYIPGQYRSASVLPFVHCLSPHGHLKQWIVTLDTTQIWIGQIRQGWCLILGHTHFLYRSHPHQVSWGWSTCAPWRDGSQAHSLSQDWVWGPLPVNGETVLQFNPTHPIMSPAQHDFIFISHYKNPFEQN